MGGKARDGLTELHLENNETDDIEKEPSLGCVLVLVKKVIAHQMEDEAVPTTVKMWSCSASHPAPSTKVSRKCLHTFTLELSTLGVIPWSSSRRQVSTLLFRKIVQWEEDLLTAQVLQDLHPR